MDTAFYDSKALEKEQLRIFDICNGCRRCFNLCPSFEVLFDRIDQEDGELDRLRSEDGRRITDLCYYCKLCYNHCPYTPPHHFQLDFPRLMLRGKAVHGRERRPRLRDRLLANTDRWGRLSSRLAWLMNWALRSRPIRGWLHRLFGIHRSRLLPAVSSQSFDRWIQRQPRGPAGETGRKVILFHTCYVNYNDPQIGKDAYAVLRKNGVEVLSPRQQCCGMPFFETGDLESARAKAEANVKSLRPHLDSGYEVVALMPTCSLMFKKEYPFLLGEAADPLSSRTLDICEYLMRQHDRGQLATDFRQSMGRIAYQIPCHLRDQNIGYRSRDLMRLIPETQVEVIERCSAHDGSWGVKTEHYDASLKTALPLLREMKETRAELFSTDCPLAGLQIEEGTGRRPLHPIQVFRKAYGI